MDVPERGHRPEALRLLFIALRAKARGLVQAAAAGAGGDDSGSGGALRIHVMALDAAGAQLSGLYNRAAREGRKPQRHASVERVWVELTATRSSRTLLRQALEEVKALAERSWL